MTILRSREILAKPLLEQSDIEPSTPARTQEPSVPLSPDEIVPGSKNTTPRRSLRLAQQCEDADECVSGLTEKMVSVSVCGERSSNADEKFLSLRSGKRVAKRGDDRLGIESRKLELGGGNKRKKIVNLDTSKEMESGSGSKRNKDLVEENIARKESEDKVDYQMLNGDIKQSGEMVDLNEPNLVMEGSSVSCMLSESLMENCAQVVPVENEIKNKGKGRVEDSIGEDDVQVICGENDENPSSSLGRRKYTREEKGKGIQVENVPSPIAIEIVQVDDEEMKIENSINNGNPPDPVTEVSATVNAVQAQDYNRNEFVDALRTQHFRDVAKRNASKFAYFDAQMEEEEELSDGEGEQQFGDWPGPFSTAMKIIKDREENMNQGSFVVVNKERSSPTIWVPRRKYSFASRKPPSLQELSLRILVKNADDITSLDYIPDVLRVKLCHLLCDSRRMNVHFLELLVRGSPAEICVPDCSWLTEEQFTECFKSCDTSNLMVLQLDQCGRCMPDYLLDCTLAKSPNHLPMLSSLSLSGACRLSDVGLRALVSAAPAITSINLTQCSLLTSSSINMISDSLGSILRELYINECQNIDLKLILSALKKFEKLEVLSLADIPSVRGRFLREFVTARGQTLKQLILTNSGKLTDPCVKAISENCPKLSVLDLANVCKLTDSSLGYLANGCQALEKLILCRNSFSDEAVAAFIETAGGSLKELSLNNVKKVGRNTALALGKDSGKLQILDLSWCRDMSDDLLGYIVDNCSYLKVLKVFGCTQITDVFVQGHSNPNVKILGLKMVPFLGHLTKSLADS